MDELTGIDDFFPQDETYSGLNGDGSVPTKDWFESLLESKVVASAAGSAVTAILGPQKVIQTSDGTYQTIPGSQQGGDIGEQSQVASPLSMVPRWIWWIAGGVGALFFLAFGVKLVKG